jgi:hypothetical protein
VKRDAGTSALEARHAAIVIIEPMDVERAGMAVADLPALPGAGGGRGATIGRDLADGQCLAAMLDCGVGLGDGHGHGSARISGGGQGARMTPGRPERPEMKGSDQKHLLPFLLPSSWKRGGRGRSAQGFRRAYPILGRSFHSHLIGWARIYPCQGRKGSRVLPCKRTQHDSRTIARPENRNSCLL